MATPSSLDPWNEQGIPIERQYRSWKQIVKESYRKLDIDAYSRARIILEQQRDLREVGERWQRVMSGPELAIETFHPAPYTEALEGNELPVWVETPATRSQQAL